MRKLIWIVVALALLWCIWWVGATLALRTGIHAWFEDRRAAGFVADVAQHRSAGFPLRLESQLDGISLADPARGLAFDIPSLTLEALAYWPGHVDVALTPEPMRFATPTDKVSLQAEDARADLHLHPGAALELAGMSARSKTWVLRDAADVSLYEARGLTLSMTQDFDASETYNFFAMAPAFALGEATRRALRIPQDWPLTFDRLELDASIAFDKPWDISALNTAAPQPRRIDLRLAEAAWGDLRLFAAADLEVDADGVPTGTVNLQAENWQTMLDVAEGAGLLPAALRTQAEEGLGMLARMSGDPTALDVQLNLRGGFMAVGIIPIGPAPRIRIR